MRLFLLLACCLLMSALLADSAAPGPHPPLAAQWKKIDALLAKEQTATAAPLVERAYQQARREGSTPNYVRALLYKIRLLENKQNDAEEKAIALLEGDLKTAQFPARPILHSLLAGLYAQYFNEHRYQLYQRTPGAAPTTDPATPGQADGGTGLATWDARRLGGTIARHYRLSVQDEPLRQLQTTLAELGDLATGGDAEGRARRPSLYDLLAQRAIAGLQNQELTVTEPEQQFALSSLPAARLFGPAAEFAALPLPTPADDSLNHQLLTLQLLQQLTRQRLTQPQRPAALAAVDLQRLEYLHQLAPDTAQAAAYEPALARAAATYQALPIASEFIAAQAEARHAAGNDVAAVRLARAAEARFSQSRGGVQAHNLRIELTQPAVEAQAAEVVAPGQPWRLDLTTRNVAALYLRAYRLTLAEWVRFEDGGRRNQPPVRRFARALRAAPAATFTLPVPTPAADYAEQHWAAAGPALPPGHYLLVASSAEGAPATLPPTAATAYARLAANELRALRRDPAGGQPARLLVLHRHTGQPLPDVQATPLYKYTDQPATRPGPPLRTDADGLATLPAPPAQASQYLASVRLSRGRDTLLLPIAQYYNDRRDNAAPSSEAETRCFLYTDRAIYRPGQTVYFKGIVVERRGSNTRLLTGQAQSVRLLDVNDQAVQTLNFQTNDYGSFHGSLVLPAGLLNGEFQLATDAGSHTIQVEDYKRPTFQAVLDSVPGRPQLEQPLTLTGRASAYAGQATDRAAVQYRVVRRVLWPLFGGYRGRTGYPGRGGAQEIAHGTATTDAEGRFSFTFTPPTEAQPPGRYQPGYLFEVTADVTSAAGETQTARRNLVLGHNPLSLSLIASDAIDKQAFGSGDDQPSAVLQATNATGELVATTGTLRLLTLRDQPLPPGVPGPVPQDADHTLPGEVLRSQFFDTKSGASLYLAALLAGVPTGRYRLEALAAGPDSATAHHDFVLYDAQAATVPYATADWVVTPEATVAPGQAATLLLGSAEPAYIRLDVERGGRLLRQQWLRLAAGEQRRVVIESGPADLSGPLYVHTTQVRANQLYQHTLQWQVAAPAEPLSLSIASFRDRLQPGQRETWRVSIHRPDGPPAAAELLATLYDQSLDVFRRHEFELLSTDLGYVGPVFDSWEDDFSELRLWAKGGASVLDFLPEPNYPRLNTWGMGEDRVLYTFRGRAASVMAQNSVSAAAPQARSVTFTPPVVKKDEEVKPPPPPAPSAPPRIVNGKPENGEIPDMDELQDKEIISPKSPNLAAIPTRSDFRETAFWEPALRTDAQGNVVLEFQMPEAVTRWQLLALAHDQQLRSGQLARQLVTQKEIQLTPNAPRFLRPGDSFAFAATLANLTDAPVAGTAQLTLLDAATGQDITARLLPGPAQQPTQVGAHQSQPLSWPLTVPTDFDVEAVTYKVVAQASREGKKATQKRKAKNENQATTFSDGEQNTLPVLPNRVLVTESLPLPIVGPGTREFELTKLTSTSSPTRRNQSLTLELTANPAWYAVQSLPYLLEYPYECSEQVFDRLYANLLAASIIRQNPRLKSILAEWQRQAQSGTAPQRAALASQLAQNQDLKNLLLQETPWVQDARSETERLARLSALFDSTRLATETSRALQKLRAMQLPDGSFPWFERMPTDRYLTQVIVAGLGKLKTLGAFDASTDNDTADELLTAALGYLDGQLTRDYAALRKQPGVQLSANHLTDEQVQALYARSYWPAPAPAAATRLALAYYQQQAARYWPGRTRYLQAQLALALHRADAKSAASAAIVRALRENALHSPELGMYWADGQPGPYWREAPTETQATLLEAFSEIANDQPAVNELKLWLLKQKQAQHWPSTRATADACYALLLRGADWLAAPAQPLQVSLGGQPLALPAGQAGTGYLTRTWPGPEVQPAQGRVSLTKPTAGVAWGALYWQYFEDLDKVTASSAALSLERQLYRETRTATGPTLEKLTATSPLRVGEVLVVRLVLRTDRPLEYVHLKDQRAAGLEPISQLSGYRYEQELGYYESPRDAATHFFFGAVPRGTHVLEYRLRASQAGRFSGGLSQVQCLYAPEFGATSAGAPLVIGQ